MAALRYRFCCFSRCAARLVARWRSAVEKGCSTGNCRLQRLSSLNYSYFVIVRADLFMCMSRDCLIIINSQTNRKSANQIESQRCLAETTTEVRTRHWTVAQFTVNKAASQAYRAHLVDPVEINL
jgi:hypothetical protein